jgi:D-beta-D-heptose 7-phosphate kinase/D-beta-D-heptose 1-phosphate adenosyltransferase
LVVIFPEDTPLALIETLRPDVLVKGGDYTPESVVGRELVEANGGKVVIVPLLKGKSTTEIVKSLRG